MITWEINITRESFIDIVNGEKIYIGSANHELTEKDYRNVKPEDVLEFYLVDESGDKLTEAPCYWRKVEKVLSFNILEEALKNVDLQKLNPRLNTLEENLQHYYSINSYKERIEKYGFTVIKFK